MKKLHLVLALFFCCFLGVQAESLITAEKGYYLSLSKDKKELQPVDRSQMIYLYGPFKNVSGKDLNIDLGIELVNQESKETYFKVLSSDFLWKNSVELVYRTFNVNYVISNGVYSVRPMYMLSGKDASVRANWEYISQPEGVAIPTLEIAGEEIPAYLSAQPYVGNINNVAEIDQAKMHISITAVSDLNDAQMNAFVFEKDGSLSIGYFPFVITQNAGETKEYEVGYLQAGSKSAPLEVGKTYEVNCRLFVGRKERYFAPSEYLDFTFSVVASGSDIETIEQNNVSSDAKIMMEDGTVVIRKAGVKYNLQGQVLR